MKTSTIAADDSVIARPKYYEMDGALRANANRAWLLAFLTIPLALVAIVFAVFVRLQPPTVIRIGPNGDASVLGQPAKGAVSVPPVARCVYVRRLRVIMLRLPAQWSSTSAGE